MIAPRALAVLILGALCVLTLAVSGAGGAGPTGHHRSHRLHVPPPPTAAKLAVDEGEWYVRPSHTTIAAGTVQLQVYNRGMDDHDLTVLDASGAAHQVGLKPGTGGPLTVDLKPGTYTLFCSLFAGTPESHRDLGMAATITVR